MSGGKEDKTHPAIQGHSNPRNEKSNYQNSNLEQSIWTVCTEIYVMVIIWGRPKQLWSAHPKKCWKSAANSRESSIHLNTDSGSDAGFFTVRPCVFEHVCRMYAKSCSRGSKNRCHCFPLLIPSIILKIRKISISKYYCI